MDIDAVSEALDAFVAIHRVTFERLGNRQAQILELAAVVGVTQHYASVGFAITVVNPIGGHAFVVKTGTRGHPSAYSSVRCIREADVVELHMNLLVQSAHDDGTYCVDVGIVSPDSVPRVKGKEAWKCIANEHLISFAEVKKLVIYPMLLAQFLGIVHEIKPSFLQTPAPTGFGDGTHLPPTLIALGHFSGNSRTILDSFVARGYTFCVAENYDIRLASARREGSSPFYGTWEVTPPRAAV
jgi:hypothetical protein